MRYFCGKVFYPMGTDLWTNKPLKQETKPIWDQFWSKPLIIELKKEISKSAYSVKSYVRYVGCYKKKCRYIFLSSPLKPPLFF